jgi:chromosome segregation ATPase
MNRSGNGRDWGMYEEPFEAEESEFVCDGDQEPLQTDRTSELAIESWNLKKTVMDLSTEILKLKSALRTQKNLTKNLQKINASVQQENKDRAKDNVHLRSTVVNLEKQLSDLSQQSAGLTTNVMRQKKVANQLQGKLAESYTHHTQQLKEKDAVIQKLNDQLAQLMEEKRSEKERQENENLFLKNERERLNSSVQVLTRRCEVAERENNHLNEELSKTREHCTDAARFLNSELEKVWHIANKKRGLLLTK